MAKYPNTIPYSGTLGTTDTTDKYPTHMSILGLGGHHQYTTIEDRDNIPIERRQAGMWVTITSPEHKTYELEDDLITWTEKTFGGTTGEISVENISVYDPLKQNDVISGFAYEAGNTYVSYINAQSENIQFQSSAIYRCLISAYTGESPENTPAKWEYNGQTIVIANASTAITTVQLQTHLKQLTGYKTNHTVAVLEDNIIYKYDSTTNSGIKPNDNPTLGSWVFIGFSSFNNLSQSGTTTTLTILSDTGTDIILSGATTTEAGLLTASDKIKLDLLQPFSGTNSNSVVNDSAIITGATVTNAVDNLAELINKLATHPTYTSPTSSITNITNTYELGDTQSINITQIYTQNDGGSKVSENITKNSIVISSGSSFSEILTIVPTTTYGGSVTYSTGPIKLNNLDIPDPVGRILSGTTTSSTRTISGIYPVYYLKSSLPITSTTMQTAINNGSANKLVINSTGTISIPYAPNSEYVAVAYPATSTTKTKWYVTALSNGNIPGGVFGAQSTLNVNSFQGYWSNVPYKIHVTPLLSNPSATTIQLQN